MDKKSRILIIDDEKEWQNIVKEILEKEYDITTAEDGNKAIELIEKNDFHLIITDIRMESEFKGIEIVEFVKTEYPNTPIIVLTAQATIPIATSSLKKGAFEFLVKGASNEEIRNKVIEALQKREDNEKRSFDDLVLNQFPHFFSEMCRELKSNIEPMAKFRRQIDLFEVLLKFFSIVVIAEYVSGEKRIPDIDARLIGTKVDAPSLGDWFNMCNELYTKRKEFQDYFFLNKFSGFFRGKNRKLMQDFIEIRNSKWGHGSKISDFEYNNLINKCNDIILTLLNDLRFLSDFLLCNIIHLKFKQNQKKYKLIECTGANAALLPSEKIFKTLLPCDEIILLHLGSERYQTLYPFIILEDCEICFQPEIFIFSKLSHNKIHYLSYQAGHELTSDTHIDFFQRLMNGGYN